MSPWSSVQPGTRTKRTHTGWWRAARRRANASVGAMLRPVTRRAMAGSNDLMSSRTRSVASSSSSLARAPRYPDVSSAVWRPRSFAPARTARVNAGLQQWLASGDGQPAAGGADESPVLARPGPARRLRSSAARSASEPGVRVVAVHAAQRAARGEHDEPGTRTVDARGQVPGVHRPSDLGQVSWRLPQARGGHGHRHTDPWKVRLTTSSCCSRVSRMKLTAYPETRIVSCG